MTLPELFLLLPSFNNEHILSPRFTRFYFEVGMFLAMDAADVMTSFGFIALHNADHAYNRCHLFCIFYLYCAILLGINFSLLSSFSGTTLCHSVWRGFCFVKTMRVQSWVNFKKVLEFVSSCQFCKAKMPIRSCA